MSKRILSIIPFLLLAACGSDSSPTSPGSVTVTGVVTAIDDQTPVDGGVTIDIRKDDGSAERLLFGSLFTLPPPSQERLALYEVIREVRVGDRVRAEGSRSEGGMGIESLEVL